MLIVIGSSSVNRWPSLHTGRSLPFVIVLITDRPA
jgi:hypothetical protein